MRLRNLLIYVGILVGFSEGVTIIVASFLFLDIIISAYGAIIQISALLPVTIIWRWKLSPMREGYALVDKTDDKYLTWLWVHIIYVLASIANLFLATMGLVFFAFVFSTAGTYSFELILLWISITFASMFNYLSLNIVGQRYEDIRGASYLGVSALAHLAEKMVVRKTSRGLVPLIDALSMSERLFGRQGFKPKQLHDVRGTLESLTAVGDALPYGELGGLARSLQLMPTPNEVPKGFANFLSGLQWPLGFEHTRGPSFSIFQRLTILLTTLLILATTFNFIPVEDLLTLAGRNLGLIMVLSIAFSGLLVSTFGRNYIVPISFVRRYWHDDDNRTGDSE